jgi:hypothetical protein
LPVTSTMRAAPAASTCVSSTGAPYGFVRDHAETRSKRDLRHYLATWK